MEKTEQPTAHKLKKSKEKGQVSKSAELSACVLILALLFLVMSLGQSSIKTLTLMVGKTLQSMAFVQSSDDYIFNIASYLIIHLSIAIMPILLLLVLISIAVQISQTGFVFSAEPLKFKFNRINPIQGFKKLLSIVMLFNALKACAKLSLCALVAYLFYKNHLTTIISVQFQSPAILLEQAIKLLIALCGYLIPIFIIIAIIDFKFVKAKHMRDLKMTKHEVKQEYKEREGCPKIKSKRKSLQQSLLKKSQAMRNIKNADVLITNPTHVAVAIEFDKSMIAPNLIVKVKGTQVVEAKKIARLHGVNIIENISLARGIYKKAKDSQPIPFEFFKELAEILKPILIAKGKL